MMNKLKRLYNKCKLTKADASDVAVVIDAAKRKIGELAAIVKAVPVNLNVDTKAGEKAVKQINNQIARNNRANEIKIKYNLNPEIFISPEEVEAAQKAIDGINKNIQQLLSNTIQDAAVEIGAGIGDALSGVKDPFSGLLSLLGDALKSFGKYLIEIGLIKAGIDKAIASLSLTGIGAGLAIAAGAAAVALGQVLKNQAQKKSQSSFHAFADGGIVYGPTRALVGEYAGAANNPEVIAPLNKLKEYIGGGGDNYTFTLKKAVTGQEMDLMITRYNRFKNR